MKFQLKIYLVFLIIATASICPAFSQSPEMSKKKMKVFILAGQSNMEGRADANKILSKDLKRLSKVQGNVQLAYNNEPLSYLRAVKPTAEIAEIYKRELIFGPELFFGITMSEAMTDEKILLIKLSEGATSLHGCWNAEWSKKNAKVMGEENESKLYSALTNYIYQTLSMYERDEYELCGMLWVQGETDAGNAIAAAAYGQNLQQFIVKIRQDLKNDSLPFLLFQVGYGKVVEGMINTSQEIPNVTLIPQSIEPMSTDFYPKLKNGHYNYEGMKKLGERFAKVFLKHYQ